MRLQQRHPGGGRFGFELALTDDLAFGGGAGHWFQFFFAVGSRLEPVEGRRSALAFVGDVFFAFLGDEKVESFGRGVDRDPLDLFGFFFVAASTRRSLDIQFDVAQQLAFAAFFAAQLLKAQETRRRVVAFGRFVFFEYEDFVVFGIDSDHVLWLEREAIFVRIEYRFCEVAGASPWATKARDFAEAGGVRGAGGRKQRCRGEPDQQKHHSASDTRVAHPTPILGLCVQDADDLRPAQRFPLGPSGVHDRDPARKGCCVSVKTGGWEGFARAPTTAGSAPPRSFLESPL